ncbi:unnamed protein product [Brassica rapa]|uniref:Guanylate kinase-like domain-containing protein n=2 Tax=Brassica TaxID=3705 RepID=A0A8D9GLL9_BRACM|nr:unnamed protein product [Brassica napus]CAG7882875.1 unnamed protein product [Brassica rapa]
MEIQRIQDSVTIISNRLMKAIMPSKLESAPVKQPMNIIEQPNAGKYKRLRKGDPPVKRKILNFAAAVEILSVVIFGKGMFKNMKKGDESFTVDSHHVHHAITRQRSWYRVFVTFDGEERCSLPFTDKTVMEKEINDEKFLEFASVHGNLYGTSIESVEVVTDSGKRCILDTDVQGARSVKASSLDAVFIFVCPPSMKELEDRLRDRGTETEEQIQKRLRNAEAEIKAGKSSGIFEHILYNDNLEECYKNLKNLLGINGDAPVNGVEAVEEINLPREHTVTKMEDKILIQETGAATKNDMIGLDLSSINGGALGRTRGIVLDTVKSPEFSKRSRFGGPDQRPLPQCLEDWFGRRIIRK